MSLDGAYTLIARLGEGGMAEVFKAIKRGPDQFEKPIALKRILPHFADQEGFIKMLSAEARLQAGLDHPNIVALLDFFKHEETFMIALEYVPGKNLKQIVTDARHKRVDLSWQALVHIISEVLLGLDFAHKRRGPNGPLHIVHRDISPQNILISYEGHVKLSDFGIALARMDRDPTQSGLLKGKYRYLSPEQLNHQTVDHRADLFSIGVVLYELLAQKHPFDQGHDFETMKLISKSEYTPLSNLRPDLPNSLLEAIQQGLQKDREHRPLDAGTFRQHILQDQDKDWLTFGSQRLKETILAIYPKRSDRTDPSIEHTPVLSRHGTPITGVICPSESVLSATEIQTRGQVLKRTARWAIPFMAIALFALLLLGPSQVAKEPSVTQVSTGIEFQPLLETPANLPNPANFEDANPESRPEVIPVESVMGTLNIRGPMGSKVFIAGHEIGTLPMKDHSLAAKSYLVSIKPPDLPIRWFRTEIQPAQRTVIDWSTDQRNTP